MTGRLVLTAVYEQVEDGWTQARIEQLPAVVTAAPTAAEAKELLVDALYEYLLSLGASDQPARPRGRPSVCRSRSSSTPPERKRPADCVVRGR